MRLNAYVLAADPTWLRSSIQAYYDHVDRIIVSYDEQSLGWSGAPIPVAECLAAIAACDPRGKVELLAGQYSAPNSDLMKAETRQRTEALAAAGVGADWVLQLDTDEILPDPAALIRVLTAADTMGLRSVEWPMRILFRRLSSGGYLEVAERDGSIHVNYPGSIAVRSGVTLVEARRTGEDFLRVTVGPAADGLQIRVPPDQSERRQELISDDQIVWHNSWARSPSCIRTKMSSWGHADASWTNWFYFARWYPAPLIWPLMRNFHPISPGLWPQLRRLKTLPVTLHADDLE